MPDRLIRGTASNNEIRFVVTDSTGVVKTAQEYQKSSPHATVVLGRLLTASMLLSVDLKGLSESMTLSLQGEGPLGKATAVTERGGYVRGFVNNPTYIPENDEKVLLQNIGSLVGSGFLNVIRHQKNEQPYTSTSELRTGEIAEDLTYFLFQSDQVPSACSLGVLIDEKAEVKRAGGFLIQLLPSTPEATIVKLEENISSMPYYTDLLDMGFDAEKIVKEIVLKGFDVKIMDETAPEYRCNCSREKFRIGLKMLSKEDLNDMKHEDVVTECHFCDKKYTFSPKELEEIIIEKRENK